MIICLERGDVAVVPLESQVVLAGVLAAGE